jgi:hypothetical protein
MKSILLAAVMLLGAFQINAQTAPTPTDISKVLKFTNDNYNMGKIAYGKTTEFTVDVENISASPITLDNVMVGCGCTTPKFTKGQVIAPGAHASVVLGFNGSSMGAFTKMATVFFSGNMTKQISFYGEGVQQ